MPIRKRLKRLKENVSSWLEDILTGGVGRLFASLSTPDIPATSNLSPPQPLFTTQSETNISISAQDRIANSRAPEIAGLPTYTFTDETGALASRPRQTFTSGLENSTGKPDSESPHVSPGEEAAVDGWANLKKFLTVIDQCAGAFGPLKAIVGELVASTEMFESIATSRSEFQKLQVELEELFRELQNHYSSDLPPAVTASVENLCKSIQKELAFVKQCQSEAAKRRMVGAMDDADHVLACYRRIHGQLRRLSLSSNLSLYKVVDELATNARLDRLRPSLSACYDSVESIELRRGACTPGTRIEVLGQIHNWVQTRAAGSVYWLNGMAGTGKTTIAFTLCDELALAHSLGASFFCSRSLPECRDVSRIIPSIAYQLARFSLPFRCALSRILEAERDSHTRLAHVQFENLIIKPIREVRDTLPDDIAVIIDALDECDNKKSTRQILEALLTKAPDLPIKFFIASRPEPEIRDQLHKKQDGQQDISRLVLHELDKGTVQGDIKAYLRVALDQIEPSESEISALVERAGILFIYAATVIRYIGHDNFKKNPRRRLKNVLESPNSSSKGNNPYKDIDELYTLVLLAAFEDPDLDEEDRNDMQQVLHTVLCAHEPLTTTALSGLLGLGDVERVDAALRPLWSVLHVVESSGLVTTLHASFPDYMFDRLRSKSYLCDRVAHNHALTRHCFDRIKNARPQFNICSLESSYVADDKVPNIQTKVKQAIPMDLLYSCRYWAAHLAHTRGVVDITERLHDFMLARLLLWMEVMNLTKHMSDGVEMMRRAEEWCKTQSCLEESMQLIRDAWRFATGFASNPVSQSTPHLYISMLRFWPESSPVASCYIKQMKGMIKVQGTAMESRSSVLMAVWSVDESVDAVAWASDGARIALISGGRLFLRDSLMSQLAPDSLTKASHVVSSVAFSLDCTFIVSGSRDGTIRIWDSLNGNKVLGPIKGHTAKVASVVFSPDGTYIISGSNDKTVRVWDSKSGQTRFAPFTGHTGAVTSVAVSPDGTHVISASHDKTIRMWDAKSGRAIHSPLTGHSDHVLSIAFSPDSASIVSGSKDRTIRVWETQSAQTILDPLNGHSDWVTCVAFSPDGTRIVSGSKDKTIRVWDARSGCAVLGPLDGHAGSIASIVVSPDSSRIISGSADRTLRMWDAYGQAMTRSSASEGGSIISSIALSFDGTRIASGSQDAILHIWDLQSGNAVLGPLKRHIKPITSVTFSTDDARIASGSEDWDIYVWDAQNGRLTLGPLDEHSGSVTALTFSPENNWIISGSEDRNIYIWDAQSGQIILGPLEGHTDAVLSVACSPDSSHIVSSSRDRTIRVWNTRGGQTVLGPLTGHADSITAVTFSPDGTWLVSSSNDKTIRFWDVKNGDDIFGPLTGPSGLATPIVFAPDRTYILSCSKNNTILAWNAQRGGEATHPPNTGLAPFIWEVDSSGWLVDAHNRSTLLAWVPPELRSMLLHPRGITSLGTGQYVRLLFTSVCIGDSWAGCHSSST